MTGFRGLVLLTSLCLSSWIPSAAASASTREFLAHCQTTPEPCKREMFLYFKFLVDGDFIDGCIMRMPAAEVAKQVLQEMGRHPERGDEEWTDGLEDALKGLKLCFQ